MSELLMALIHAQSNFSGGVPGITRASEIIGKGEDVINFNEDAMPKGKPIGGYWKGSYGAFGTYYAASLQEMGIIAPLENNTSLYNVTPKSEDYISGEDLADAFQQSVGLEMSKLFFDSVHSGIVTREQLALLEPVFQSHNMPDNNERNLLLNLLLQNDKPSSLTESKLRKDSLRLLLSYMRTCSLSNFSELEFAKYVYDSYNNGSERSTAAVGWYAYYLNDSRQYEALNIFDVLLNRLHESTKPGQWENIDDFSSTLAAEVCENLGAANSSIGELLDRWNSVEEPEQKNTEQNNAEGKKDQSDITRYSEPHTEVGWYIVGISLAIVTILLIIFIIIDDYKKPEKTSRRRQRYEEDDEYEEEEFEEEQQKLEEKRESYNNSYDDSQATKVLKLDEIKNMKGKLDKKGKHF
jgi:hypothetical protein